MPQKVYGGTSTYGQVVGILMLDSTIPRIPGDPGHAETFPFPVRYEVIQDFPFQDLVELRSDHISSVIQAARKLESEGVSIVAADCGLFSLFQQDIANALRVPFLGSALNLIPFITGFLPASQKIGLITGDTRLLKSEHLQAAGADPERLVISGMEHSEEFHNVVIQRGNELDVDNMRKGVVEAAQTLAASGDSIGAVVLECTNLITFRQDVQRVLGAPVFDAVSLIEFFVSGLRLRTFTSEYLSPNRLMR